MSLHKTASQRMRRTRRKTAPQRAAAPFIKEPTKITKPSPASRPRRKRKVAASPRRDSQVRSKINVATTDPFQEAFSIQMRDGQLRRYQLVTADGVMTSSGPASIGEEKMANLQAQLLAIQEKQTICRLQMVQERKKVEELQKRIRELEEERGRGIAPDALQTQGDTASESEMQSVRTDTDGKQPSRTLGDSAQEAQTHACLNADITQLTKQQVISAAGRFIEEPTLSLFAHQILGTEPKVGASSWNTEIRKLSLDCWRKAPLAYQFLEEVFAMPSLNTLQTWMADEEAFICEETPLQDSPTTAMEVDNRLEESASNLQEKSSHPSDPECKAKIVDLDDRSESPEQKVVEQTVVVYLDRLQPIKKRKR